MAIKRRNKKRKREGWKDFFEFNVITPLSSQILLQKKVITFKISTMPISAYKKVVLQFVHAHDCLSEAGTIGDEQIKISLFSKAIILKLLKNWQDWPQRFSPILENKRAVRIFQSL